MRYKFILFALVLASMQLITHNNAIAANAISRGAMLSNSCAGCHGTDGASPGSIPSIKGRSADYIVKALTDFRDGTRPSTVMGRHAKGYTDEEIRLIAEYFASLK